MVFNILVVDDEPHVLESMSFLLQERMDMDCQVHIASSAEEAVQAAQKNHLHLLITDVRMPGMTGLELIEQIRSAQPRCRAVVLTGYSDFSSAYSAIHLGVVGYLLKTEEDDVIVETINRILKGIEAEQPKPEPETNGNEARTNSGDYIADFVKKYIRTHISADLSIGSLSEAAGYSEDYLSRMFRQSVGITIGQYIAKQRMELVTELLANEGISLDEICRMVGISSRSYFNRFVKMATGLSPRQLRSQIKADAAEAQTRQK